MKVSKGKAWMVVGLVVIALLGVCIVSGWRRVPTFEGRGLDEWMDYLPMSIDTLDKSGEYVKILVPLPGRSLGMQSPNSLTNFATQPEFRLMQKACEALDNNWKAAVPMLMERLQKVDSPLKNSLRAWAAKAHLPQRMVGESAGLRRVQAVTGLIRLKNVGHLFSPELMRLTKHPDREVRKAAFMVLKGIGEPVDDPERGGLGL
jgi:hypothetical protein